MSEEKLYNLYNPKPNDKVVDFVEGNGFSLVSDYPEGREGRSVFVRVFLDKDNKEYLAGDVMMVDSTESLFGGHSISDNNHPSGKVTNFNFNSEDDFIFKEGRVFNKKFKNKSLGLNEFVDILIRNHNTDKNVKFRFKYRLVSSLVKFIVWLVDIDFNKIDVFELKNSMNVQIKGNKEKGTQEPFLRYFNVPKNMFTIFVFIVFFLSIIFWNCLKYIEVTDIRVVICSATIFMLMDWLSRFINSFLEISCSKEDWLVRGIHFSHGFMSGGKVELDFNI